MHGWSVAASRSTSGDVRVSVMDTPAIEVNYVAEIFALLPTLLLEFRLWAKFGNVANTQIRDGSNPRRDSKYCLHRFEVQDADPSDTQRLRASRKPKILNRANG